MKTYRYCAALTVSMLLAAPAYGLDKHDLLGQWEASCEFFGSPANCAQTWRPGLHDDLLVMEYRVLAPDDGRQVFAGNLFLKQLDDHLGGYWVDSIGSMHDVHALWNESALESHWGSPATEQGRSRYRLSERGELQVTDWVLTDDGWREFLSAVYRRSTESGAGPG